MSQMHNTPRGYKSIYLHHNLLHLTFFSNLLACTKCICPLRCSTITSMLSLKVIHKCLINTIVPIISIIWLGIGSTNGAMAYFICSM